jgi:chromosome segregation ATPase
MGSIDGLREQVEELKQRLNSPGVQLGADAEELKTRLASIKSNLEGKQQEIAKLTAEKQQLAAEKQRLAAEAQRAAAENEQLRTLLGEVMAVIDGQSADGPAKLLREFLDETDSLVKPATNGVKEAQPAEQSADQAASAPGRAEPARAGQQPQGAQGAGGSRPDPDVAIELGSDVHDEAPEEEESPALRRILKRGRRAG